MVAVRLIYFMTSNYNNKLYYIICYIISVILLYNNCSHLEILLYDICSLLEMYYLIFLSTLFRDGNFKDIINIPKRLSSRTSLTRHPPISEVPVSCL